MPPGPWEGFEGLGLALAWLWLVAGGDDDDDGGVFSFLEWLRIVSIDKLEHISMVSGKHETETRRVSVTWAGSRIRVVGPLVVGGEYCMKLSRVVFSEFSRLTADTTVFEGLS